MTTKTITVLVTGVGGGVGQGVLKSLKAIKSLNIYVIACDISNKATGLYVADESLLLPKLASKNYVENLLAILKNKEVDFFVPGLDMELEFCARNSKMIKEETGTEVVVSPVEVISIADDKYLTYKFLLDNGFDNPTTFLTKKDFLASGLSYPVIVKPRIGYRSIGVHKIETEKELNKFFKEDSGLIIQQCVGSDDSEYTCTVVSSNGLLSDVLPLKRELRLGDTYRAQPVKDEKISSYVHEIAKALNINGSCNFQLRVDINGVPKLFEINARFSGTTPFCTHIGFNPIEFYLKNKLGIPYNYDVDYDCILLRYWSEMVVSKQELLKLSEKKSCRVIEVKKCGL